MKSILDPSFCYTPSLYTDVRKTFERVRRELRQAATLRETGTERNGSVLTLPRGPAGFSGLRRANLM